MSEYSRSNTGKLKLGNSSPAEAISDESLADVNITTYKIGDGQSYAKTNEKLVPVVDNEDGTQVKKGAVYNSSDLVFKRNSLEMQTIEGVTYYVMPDLTSMEEGTLIKKSDVIVQDTNYHNKKQYTIKSGTQMYYLESLDTGGYTGSWGPDGRWALLHQKEIVLNAHDTENFLAGINVLRDITKAIDLQAMSYNGLINNYLPYLQNTNTNTLQQDVTIHAEFPNATDHNEIQLAIEGLVNSAAQRANRK